MIQFIRFTLLFLLVISCTSNTIYKKPANLISEEQMVDLIFDIQLANGARNIKNKDGKRLIEYMPLVYEKYGIDSAQFAQSNFYYSTKIDDYTKLLKKVQTRLAKMEKEYDAKVQLNDSLNKVNGGKGREKIIREINPGKLNPSNLFEAINDFNNNKWGKSQTGDATIPKIISTDNIAPDNSKTASNILFETKGSKIKDRSFIRQKINVDPTKIYTISFWLKSATKSNQKISVHANGSPKTTWNINTEWKKFEYSISPTVDVTYWGLELNGIKNKNKSSNIFIWNSILKIKNTIPSAKLDDQVVK